MTNTYWTPEMVAGMTDAELAAFITTCRNGENIAMATRNGKAMRRYGFLLERLAYPEQDRRSR